MSKTVTDLNEALASRARNGDHPREAERAKEAEPAPPRLAQRIVALRPLARAPSVIEPDLAPEQQAGLDLLKLSDSPRFHGNNAAPSRNALVVYSGVSASGSSYPVERSSGGERDSAPMADGRSQAAFVTGLIIATVTGIALYTLLL